MTIQLILKVKSWFKRQKTCGSRPYLFGKGIDSDVDTVVKFIFILIFVFDPDGSYIRDKLNVTLLDQKFPKLVPIPTLPWGENGGNVWWKKKVEKKRTNQNWW